MTSKGWFIFIIIVVLAIGGAIFVSRQEEAGLTNNINVNAIQTASADNGNIADHTFGTGAKVTLVEYGDYQCPGCDSAASVIKQLTEKYKDKLTFVFRNKMMPYHSNARAAASFAEAAGLQGKYWEMHDKLYATQSTWANLPASNERTDYFANLIKEIGGDPEKAKTTIESDDIIKKLNFDEALSNQQGVTSTPSFYLNGKDVGSLYVLDGKLVTKATNGAQLIWSSAEDFDKLVLQPAFKEAGIE